MYTVCTQINTIAIYSANKLSLTKIIIIYNNKSYDNNNARLPYGLELCTNSSLRVVIRNTQYNHISLKVC